MKNGRFSGKNVSNTLRFEHRRILLDLAEVGIDGRRQRRRRAEAHAEVEAAATVRGRSRSPVTCSWRASVNGCTSRRRGGAGGFANVTWPNRDTKPCAPRGVATQRIVSAL